MLEARVYPGQGREENLCGSLLGLHTPPPTHSAHRDHQESPGPRQSTSHHSPTPRPTSWASPGHGTRAGGPARLPVLTPGSPPASGRVAPAVPLQVHEAMAALALEKTRPSVEPPETPRAALRHPPSLHPAEVGTRAPTGPGPLRTCAGKTEVPKAGRSGLPRAQALGRSPGGPSAPPGGALHPQ